MECGRLLSCTVTLRPGASETGCLGGFMENGDGSSGLLRNRLSVLCVDLASAVPRKRVQMGSSAMAQLHSKPPHVLPGSWLSCLV